MSYPGSKGQAGTFQRIIGQMPPHSVYVEPFAGSAQVFFRKRPAEFNYLFDRSAGAVANLRAAISKPRPSHDSALVDVREKDGLRWLAETAPEFCRVVNRTVLIYLDPPYLLSTRKSRRYYEHELTDDDHAALLSAALQLRCYVMISGYPSELYSSRLKNWRRIDYRTRTRGATVTECLWCNFPEPTELHDWRFAGQNKRQRHKWKLSVNLFLAKLARYSPRRRGYMLDILEGRLNERPRIPTPLLATVQAGAGADRSPLKSATVAGDAQNGGAEGI